MYNKLIVFVIFFVNGKKILNTKVFGSMLFDLFQLLNESSRNKIDLSIEQIV